VAVDLWPEVVSHAAAGVTPMVLDVGRDLPTLGPGTFDVVLASNVLEHFDPDAAASVVRDVSAVLKPGGRFLIVQPNFRHAWRTYFDDYTHRSVFTDTSLPALLRAHGFVSDPDMAGLEYITGILAMASGSVDRLDEIPGRLGFLFRFDPRAAVASPEVDEILHHEGAHEVVECLARELSGAPRLVDRERFRAVVAAVKQQTGRKAKALFHPIRVALTGAAEGPELDLAVPAIERGALLPEGTGVGPISSCAARAAALAAALG
jgi:SAM-dependent methyltransferase